MKDKLKKSMKPTPESFRYTVQTAVNEVVTQPAPIKNRFVKGRRVAIAIVLIAVLLPSAVFGAAKMIGLYARPVNNYGVELSVETQHSADYPAYVKMKVMIPEGFILEPNTDELKYTELNSDGSFGEGSFSLCPMRPKNNSDAEVVGNVDSYEELTLSGHTAYRIKQVGNGYDRVYVSFEDADVLLLVYFNNVTDEQLTGFISGITFTEGTEADHTELFDLFDERNEDKTVYGFNYTNIEYPRDTVMTFSGWSELSGSDSLRYTAKISDVRIADSLNGLDSTLLNEIYVGDGLTDNSGKLLPRTVTVTKAGDGFNTVDEVISSEEKEQKLVFIDLSYTNLSNEDTVVYIPYNLEAFDQKPDGKYDYSRNIDPANKITSSGYCDSEPLYISDPLDTVKSFYCTKLKANETKTVTIGYRCCTDVLDKAYLTIYDATSASIIDPAPDGYNGRENIPNYIIKVT